VLARVAATERSANARQYARDFYVRFDKVISGDPGELKKVSALISLDHDELVRWTPRAASNGFVIGGEMITHYRSRARRR